MRIKKHLEVGGGLELELGLHVGGLIWDPGRVG